MLKPVSTSTISSGWTHHRSRRSLTVTVRSPTDSTVATALISSSTSSFFLGLLSLHARHEWKRHDHESPDRQEEAQEHPVRRVRKCAPTARVDVVVNQHPQAILAMDNGQKQQQPVVRPPAERLPTQRDKLVVDDVDIVDDVDDQQVAEGQHKQEHA